MKPAQPKLPTARFLLTLSSALLVTWATAHLAAQQPAQPMDFFITEGRLAISTPTHPMHLAEQAEISLILKGPGVASISVRQTAKENGNDMPIAGGESEPTILSRPDGATYVNVVPIRLGKVNFEFSVEFADGGFERQTVSAQVDPTQTPPDRLDINPGITLDLTEQGRRKYLWLNAHYKTLPEPIQIPLSSAQISVIMPQGEPPIRFNPETGSIEALRTGRARIEATFAGIRRTTCVHVAEDSNIFDRTDCQDLSANSSDNATPSSETGTGRFLADDRLELPAPTRPLTLAEDNQLTLILHGPTVAKITSYQLVCSNPQQPCDAGLRGSDKVLVPRQNPDGSTTVSVFPMALGQLELTLFAVFSDGGAALKKVRFEVVPGSVKPTAIGITCGDDSYPNPLLPVRLLYADPAHPNWSDYMSKSTVVPNACYPGIPGFVTLPARLVHYNLKSEGTTQVIQLDPSTGNITALHPGQALIQEEFAGRHREICVVVAAANTFSRDLSNCRSLRSNHAAELPASIPPRPATLPDLVREQAVEDGTLLRSSKDSFRADERLEIPLQGISATLQESANLPLRLTGPPVIYGMIFQTLIRHMPSHEAIPYEVQDNFVLKHFPDGSPYVTVTPLQTGTSEFRFELLFADGGLATKTIPMPVSLPQTPPTRLINTLDDSSDSPTFDLSTIHLLLNRGLRTRTIYPRAFYNSDRPPVIVSPKDVHLSIKPAPGEPVISLDPATGIVTALRPGHALIETTFAGIQMQTCAVVMPNLIDGDASKCEELRTNPTPANH